ncbi:hypothetical protein CRG98_023858 [Punica granatum]|uniref:Uncharacterized protein n=1 Tax=Punica granatum TaxID=22663 RepID=A0A2I0JJH1_PUNGR|nr:hypothetical protein CRG98_023858 [Punica granatum]
MEQISESWESIPENISYRVILPLKLENEDPEFPTCEETSIHSAYLYPEEISLGTQVVDAKLSVKYQGKKKRQTLQPTDPDGLMKRIGPGPYLKSQWANNQKVFNEAPESASHQANRECPRSGPSSPRVFKAMEHSSECSPKIIFTSQVTPEWKKKAHIMRFPSHRLIRQNVNTRGQPQPFLGVLKNIEHSLDCFPKITFASRVIPK